MSSKNQFFLVLKEIKECQWTYYRQNEGTIRPGCVVVVRPCNGGDQFEVHRGSGVWTTPVLISREGGLPRDPDKAVAITEQEFDILMGVYLENRVKLQSDTERFEWACQLKAGDAVRIKLWLDEKESTVPGVIRGYGTSTPDAINYGLQFIVEIAEEAFEYYFGDKGKAETKFLCMKNCCIIVSAHYLYKPEQPGKTIIEETEADAVETVKVKPSLSMTQLLRKPSLKESLQQIGQQCEEMEKQIEELTSENTEKEQILHQLNEQIQNLDGELQEKVALINQQQEKLSTNEGEIEKLHNELREKQEEIDTTKEESEQQLRDQQLQHEQTLAELRQQNDRILREQQEQHQQEENRLQQEQGQLQRQIARLQQDLQEATDREQQTQARIDTAIANLRGTSQVGFDAIELWEVPGEEVHISNKILGTGGWGYVAEGTFHGQKVAVKCLHRGILSQFTTNHVRREISIMAQVRHPSLVLLIGAVLNADTGPLIITELLDRSLRSAYEEHLLEEHCKLPILRDVAAALNYLHSHRRPIIHRDVSSANVLLEAVHNNAWKAKLSDFGSANLIRLATTPAEGAVTYSAPEVRTEARNQQTPKVDVYSFGILLCEISVCRLPPDPSEFAAFLASVRDNANPRLYELAQNCTKCTPGERPSMRDILAQIGELIPME